MDLLCRAAASAVASAFGPGFAETVLLVLAEQQNLSAPVRESYLHLLGRLLDSGQEQRGYTDLLAQAGEIWRKVAAPVAVNWGIGLVDILLDTPCPDPDSRMALVTKVVGRSRGFGQRLSSRQRSELQVLAADIGMPPVEDEGTTDDDPVWKRLRPSTQFALATGRSCRKAAGSPASCRRWSCTSALRTKRTPTVTPR